MPRYLKKYIEPPGLVEPDVIIGYLEEVNKFTNSLRALKYLVHFQALGFKQANLRAFLRSDGSSMGSAVLGTLQGVTLLISQVSSKRGLVKKRIYSHWDP